MRLSANPFVLVPVLTTVLGVFTPLNAQEQKLPAKAIEELLEQFQKPGERAFFTSANELEGRLLKADKDAEEVARKLLERKAAIVSDQEVLKFLEKIAGGKKPTLAAELLLRIAHARRTVKNYQAGHVIVGQLIVEDGKVDPELVMAQMPILADGYFAGEVGDLKRPVGFRSHGYRNLDVSLEGKQGDVVYIGQVTLKPLPSGQKASLRGKILLDAGNAAEATTVVHLSMRVASVNTPHNGFSPRRRWPEGITVPVSKTGEFTVPGLCPSEYYLWVTAKDHVDYSKTLQFSPGQELDDGTYRLRCSDLGFYVGKPAPKTGELTWEKDYPTALKRAQTEKKPLLVMMTSTWCGPCRMLEKQTLNDAWIRYFLSRFVLVKAYEDKEVEKTYGLNGYPTLVFTDSAGKLAYKTVGYQPTFSFSAACARAYKKLDLKPPPELQTLIEKKVLALD